ncbi:P-loop containing nucleoside triphosphate hydrolase protein [Armillaria novae-zelandiae]|uniref:P-loop containing nucleoside triphosphate hydrolase protein n=1 Tax=Armillaria novae-zelandiae TaxID=153914 RepID=A0AA39P3L7_9AGAR|nr:P-loop containing nucleoside triphosphate hydrolase protein [Armillaria novae-zelandiae]
MNNLTSLLPRECAGVKIQVYSRQQARGAVEALLDEECVGISIAQAADDETIEYLAIATSVQVVVISLSDSQTIPPTDDPLRTLLSAGKPILAGFDMPRLCISLYYYLRYHIRAIDLSTFESTSPSKLFYASDLLSLPERPDRLDRFAVDSLWNDKLKETPAEKIRKVSLRACISAVQACRNSMAGSGGELFTPSILSPYSYQSKVLECLGHLVSQVDVLERAKPTEMSNDFTEVNQDSSGQLSLYNSRFKTRVRGSPHLVIDFTTSDGYKFKGSPDHASGKRTTINVSDPFHGGVTRVDVLGRERATNAETARHFFLLHTLQGGEYCLRQSKFVRMLWFPSKEDKKDLTSSNTQTYFGVSVGRLNTSQREVVGAMISNRPLVLVHGPPGTGKTSTISEATKIWARNRSPTWIVAHSNVAVKNIAEKLEECNVDFKIIVSKEFYVEWHQHIYTGIKHKLFHVDMLPNIGQKRQRKIIRRCSIILSTLSMLSNPALNERGMFDLVPPRTLVVDEASQINVFEYMHLFFKFRKEMTQVCFFGDPKQLPPYGQDKAHSMQSIFDINHLKDMAHMLNIQYRMPHPLSTFISREVYNNRLRSENNLTDPSCIRFVDAKYGTEKKSGFSWRVGICAAACRIGMANLSLLQNDEEVRSIVHLVGLYYRYSNFCVITPYDAQRAAIEKELKDQGLPWERVFNVDSFQGD